MDFVNIYGCDKGKFGLKKFKKTRIERMPSINKEVAVCIVKNILMKVTFSFIPKDHMKLIYEVMEQFGYPSQVNQAALDSLWIWQFRTVEKRMLHSFLTGTFGEKCSAMFSHLL